MENDKFSLRRHYSQLRAALTPQEIQHKSEKIAFQFVHLPDLRAEDTVHLFLPIKAKNEINTWYLVEQLRLHYPSIRLMISRSDFTHKTLTHYYLETDTVLVENQYGIPEPIAAKVADSQAIDWVIVPLLCFDQEGFRVGYGQGFYDRFLSTCRPDTKKVGLSLFPPIIKIADRHLFDVRLNRVLDGDFIWTFTDSLFL
ncbi:5-formyltetrahydrofolate cyclo-ligase [Thioflexithrix psekupsensis]|uniref:5-formyltetrahydrofolate cyclo-ligase n=1 Tax=Thioflexithrix psekupsensis TaxID=1570016 RepID=A0A251X773_9GAMM|nr:5-formyltetrahydrofolate cyclo-ligase [Thioflexithrix psekupsensis]OUD13918.1 5-formyltetrahydrofolate cyclo-ligase [Thioflexithrix psekupsensis]